MVNQWWAFHEENILPRGCGPGRQVRHLQLPGLSDTPCLGGLHLIRIVNLILTKATVTHLVKEI